MTNEKKAVCPPADLKGSVFRANAGESVTQSDSSDSSIREQIAEQDYVTRFSEGIKATENRPEKKTKSKRIVIEGSCGDAVTKRYWPSIKEHIDNGYVNLWMIDIQDRMSQYLTEFLSEDIERSRYIHYLNKNNAHESRAYKQLSDIDDVLIATWDSTHCDITRRWLGRARRIFIEKPLDSSLSRAEKLLKEVEIYSDETEVLCIDHYRAKALALRQNINAYLELLDKNIKKISFYLTEPRTIEDERRVDALRHGMILDLLPHLFALLMYIGPLNSIDKDQLEIRGAKYSTASIPNETFAGVRFPMKSYGGDEITVEAFVGKAVGRSNNPAMYRDPSRNKNEIKYFEIENNDGKKLLFDFALEEPRLFFSDFDTKGQLQSRTLCSLNGKPHKFLIDSIIGDTYDNDPTGFHIGEGIKILEYLNTCRSKSKKSTMSTYNIGDPPENICKILSFPTRAIYE